MKTDDRDAGMIEDRDTSELAVVVAATDEEDLEQVCHPYPSMEQIREEALEVHSELRERIRALLELYARVDWGQEELAYRLCEQVQGLVEAIDRHASIERAKLGPVLAELDAWGDLRRTQLEQVHERERAAIGRAGLDVSPCDCDARRLAFVARYLVDEVLRSLNWEEQYVLAPELFRDDCIVLNQLDG